MICIASGGASPAPILDMAATSRCDLKGFSTDTDRNGAKIRSAPRADAPVIGGLPPPSDITGQGDTQGPAFEIIGAKNGWLLIRNADTGFKGPGWISGGLVGFQIVSRALRAVPSSSARVVAKLYGTGPTGGNWGPEGYEVRRVHGCQGKFADVTIVLPPRMKPPPGREKPLRGWVDHVCSLQLTTCN
jgi:hypothetical protein